MPYLSQRALEGLKAYEYKPAGYTYLDKLHAPFYNCERTPSICRQSSAIGGASRKQGCWVLRRGGRGRRQPAGACALRCAVLLRRRRLRRRKKNVPFRCRCCICRPLFCSPGRSGLWQRPPSDANRSSQSLTLPPHAPRHHQGPSSACRCGSRPTSSRSPARSA